MSRADRAGDPLFLASAAAALAVHAFVLLQHPGLQGGADLQVHLRLMQRMAEAPALRNTFPPAYHALGALLAPALGYAAYTKLVAWAGAAGLIAGFRCFQRAAGLPAACAALFAWTPYGFALTTCLPKLETAGYALAFTALALLLRRRHAAAASLLALAFWVHAAAALFLGLTGGVLVLAQRDLRGLGALAVGSLGGAALVALHLHAGCSLAEALLFSPGDYLRRASLPSSLAQWPRLLALAGGPLLAAAVAGVPDLLRRFSLVSILAGVVLALYLNELWLAPFGARTTLDLLRGLTLLAFPVAAAAGVALAARPRWLVAGVAACAVWAAVCVMWWVPGACVVRAIDIDRVRDLDIDRCRFRWRPSAPAGPASAGGGLPQGLEIGADRGVP